MKKIKLMVSILLCGAMTAVNAEMIRDCVAPKIAYMDEIIELRRAVESNDSPQELFRIMTNLEKVFKIYDINPESSDEVSMLRKLYFGILKKIDKTALRYHSRGLVSYPFQRKSCDSDSCDRSVVELRQHILNLYLPPKKKIRFSDVGIPNEKAQTYIQRRNSRFSDAYLVISTPHLQPQDPEAEIDEFVL